jgi:hypothetical protein
VEVTMKTYTLVVKIKVPFKKSRKGIKKWVKETLESHADLTPLYVEGDIIENCNEKTSVKVKYEKDGIGWPDW